MKLFGQTFTPNIENFYSLAERAISILEEKNVLPKPAASEETKLTVEQFDNHIYFYARVDSDRCLALMRNIREIDNRLRSERATRDITDIEPTPIWLHIHSGGGYHNIGRLYQKIHDLTQLHPHPPIFYHPRG